MGIGTGQSGLYPEAVVRDVGEVLHRWVALLYARHEPQSMLAFWLHKDVLTRLLQEQDVFHHTMTWIKTHENNMPKHCMHYIRMTHLFIL